MKTNLYLYYSEEQIREAALAVRKRLLFQNKAPGIASLCGAICAELGSYFNNEELVNAFLVARVNKDFLVERLIRLAKAMVEKQISYATPRNYNDLDDDIWAHIEDTTETKELPFMDGDDPNLLKANGTIDYTSHHTRYTIYHESHGHCFLFFLKETVFLTEDGIRNVYETELDFRKVDKVDSIFKKISPQELWEEVIQQRDSSDFGFVFSGTFGPDKAEGEGTGWSHNMWTEVAHYESLLTEL